MDIRNINKHNPKAERRFMRALGGLDWAGFILMHLAMRGAVSEYERVYPMLHGVV
jgi:hypothetical protein